MTTAIYSSFHCCNCESDAESMHLCIIIYFVLEEPKTKPAIVIHNKDRNINGSGLGKIFEEDVPALVSYWG